MDKPRPTFGAENKPRGLLLLSANTAWNIHNFRMELVAALQREGYRVAVAAPPDEALELLERAGVLFVPLPMNGSGTSPVDDLILLARYWRLFRRLRPAAFLGFTPKPNIYGSIAARLCGVPTINNITGLGTAFIHGSPIERLVSALYRRALRHARAVYFHNCDDRDLVVGRRIVRADRAVLIPGSGVDLEHFAPDPLPDDGSGPTFLFAGRLLREKGVEEYWQAARAVRQAHPEARFRMIGAFADDGRGISRSEVERWQAEGTIDYLGTCSDIRPHISAADCLVLPSYREGLPRVLLEGAAMGRPSIAFDVPGCRQAIVDGRTGYLCKPRSSEALAEAMIRMIRLGPEDRQAMGMRARAYAEEQFGVERVWSEYLSVLGEIRSESSREHADRQRPV